jgi:hypothetical protein
MKNTATQYSLDTKAALNDLRHTHEEQSVIYISLKYHTLSRPILLRVIVTVAIHFGTTISVES